MPVGTGESHLAIALGIAACSQGKKVRCFRVTELITTLLEARVAGNREQAVTREFLRLKSHFLFEDHFCLVRRPNEKGHIERLLDFARRNFLAPVPRIDSLEWLNR